MSRIYSDEETRKLKQIISEGVQVKSEVEALNEGLKDTVSAIAEELDIKPALLNKAIRIAYKADFAQKEEEFSELGEILIATGRNY